MISNTQEQKINWKKINTDKDSKLREVKKLIESLESFIPYKYYQQLMDIINR